MYSASISKLWHSTLYCCAPELSDTRARARARTQCYLWQTKMLVPCYFCQPKIKTLSSADNEKFSLRMITIQSIEEFKQNLPIYIVNWFNKENKCENYTVVTPPLMILSELSQDIEKIVKEDPIITVRKQEFLEIQGDN